MVGEQNFCNVMWNCLRAWNEFHITWGHSRDHTELCGTNGLKSLSDLLPWSAVTSLLLTIPLITVLFPVVCSLTSVLTEKHWHGFSHTLATDIHSCRWAAQPLVNNHALLVFRRAGNSFTANKWYSWKIETTKVCLLLVWSLWPGIWQI